MVDMADEGTSETFEHTLAGRLMVFKYTSRSQILILQRMATVLQQDMVAAGAAKDADAVMALANKLNNITWTAVESRFTSAEDLEFVQMKILGGELEEEDLMRILANGFQGEEPADDADPAPAVKRATKKATKKAVAKKTANPRRATR